MHRNTMIVKRCQPETWILISLNTLGDLLSGYSKFTGYFYIIRRYFRRPEVSKRSYAEQRCKEISSHHNMRSSRLEIDQRRSCLFLFLWLFRHHVPGSISSSSQLTLDMFQISHLNLNTSDRETLTLLFLVVCTDPNTCKKMFDNLNPTDSACAYIPAEIPRICDSRERVNQNSKR